MIMGLTSYGGTYNHSPLSFVRGYGVAETDSDKIFGFYDGHCSQFARTRSSKLVAALRPS